MKAIITKAAFKKELKRNEQLLRWLRSYPEEEKLIEQARKLQQRISRAKNSLNESRLINDRTGILLRDSFEELKETMINISIK